LAKTFGRSGPTQKQPRPPDAGQRDPTDRKRRIGGTQGDGLRRQPVGAQRVIQCSDPQYVPGVGFGESPLHFPSAVAV